MGNITSLTTSNDATSWEFASPLGPKRNIVYDVRNMPVAIQMRTGDTLFKYDGNGNRVQKYSPEGVVTYVTDTYEIRGMQNIALYLGNVRFAEFDGETATYFLRDHINSASVSMSAAGAVLETAEYLPFGSPRASEEITSTDYTFTDQEKDRSTGLFNYDARHYDPRTGRFVSPDSILPDPYDPQQLNRYAYARNNPLRYTDPSGHWNQPEEKNDPTKKDQQKQNDPNQQIEDMEEDSNIPTAKVPSTAHGTISIGVTGTGALGIGGGGGTFLNFGYSEEYGFSFSLTGTAQGGAIAGFALQEGLAITVTNAKTVNQLNGQAYQFGRSGLGPAFVEAQKGPGYEGVTVGVTVGLRSGFTANSLTTSTTSAIYQFEDGKHSIGNTGTNAIWESE